MFRFQDIPTGADCSVTSLRCDVNNSAHVLVAGFGDGSLRLYDARAPTTHDAARVTTFRDHTSCIVATQIRAGGSKVGEHVAL